MSNPSHSARDDRLVVTAFDEYGTPLCPMTRTESGYDDAGDKRVYREVPCREELRLTVHLSINPGQGDPDVPRSAFVNENANTSAWEYVCIDGHVLATSCEEEDAEDFT